jgi:hypothetical protein
MVNEMEMDRIKGRKEAINLDWLVASPRVAQQFKILLVAPLPLTQLYNAIRSDNPG